MANIVLILVILGLIWVFKKEIKDFLDGLKGDLHSAAISGNIKKVKKFIAEGANVNDTDKNDRTPLHMAASSINLVERPLNEDQVLDSIFKQQIKLSEEIVQILIKAGADVNATDKNGQTPLKIAARYGNVAMANILIKADANVNAADKNGRTPIRMAARYGNVAMVSMLTKAGADVNAADKNGRTPIRMATGYGYKVVVSMLIKAGADVNAADRYGSTPLHLAAEKGHKNVALLLVNAGADIHAKDKFGRVPPSDIFSQ